MRQALGKHSISVQYQAYLKWSSLRYLFFFISSVAKLLDGNLIKTIIKWSFLKAIINPENKQVIFNPMSCSWAVLLSYIFLFLLVNLSQSCSSACQDCSNSRCLNCSSSYFLRDQVCLPCPSFCQTCSNSTTCLSCITGYLLYSSEICIFACDPNSCVSCSNNRCTLCHSGYTLKENICTLSQQQSQTFSTWIVFLCLIAFLIFVAFLVCCMKKEFLTQEIHDLGPIQSSHELNTSPRGQSYGNIQIGAEERRRTSWQIYIETHDLEENCSICLEATTTCITFCMHRFHDECLAAWMEKNQICPICRKQHVYPINYLCLNCYGRSYTDNRIGILRRSKQDQRCDECKLINL